VYSATITSFHASPARTLLNIKVDPKEFVNDSSWSYGSQPPMYKPNGGSGIGYSHMTTDPFGLSSFFKWYVVISPDFFSVAYTPPFPSQLRSTMCFMFLIFVLVRIFVN